MKYSNPRIPEGINTSQTHPLADFALLGGGALVLVALVIAGVSFAAGWAASLVPYRWEADLMNASEEQDASAELLFEDAAELEPQRAHLQALADALAAYQELPEGMRPVIHVVDETARNAYATLGGHIVIFTGLLEDLPNENALAMVLAHEIAHLRHRDPITSAARSASVALAFGLITGASDIHGLRSLAGISSSAALTAFSRSQETRADADAIASVAAHYGHVVDADWLFREATRHAGSPLQTFFTTHPLDADRVRALEDAARGAGWAREGETTPLPVW